jgi:FdhD protein
MRTAAVIADPSSATPQDIAAALDTFDGRQVINQTTRATHAAAYYRRGDGLIALREDVGRQLGASDACPPLAFRGCLEKTGHPHVALATRNEG